MLQLWEEVGTAWQNCVESNTWLNDSADDGGDDKEEVQC